MLLMMDKNRSELLDIQVRAQHQGEVMVELRWLRDQAALEERRLNMLRKVGLFDGYKPQQDSDPFADLFKTECRTKVEDDDDYEDHDEGEDDYEDDYEDDDDEV